MTKHSKSLWVIIVCQALCLAFGLWVHYHLVISFARWTPANESLQASVDSDLPSTADSQPTEASSTEPSAASLRAAIPLAGLVGFIWTCGLQCIVVYLILSKVYVEHVRKQNESQEASFQHRHDLVRTRDAVIFGLAKLAESRDSDTGQHLERISLYATCMASSLRRHPKFRARVTPAFVRLIGISSALHDIGKVGVEDAILLKPGKLTETERAEMQQHANIGGECLKQIEKRLGDSNFLQMAREIALYHHERWDGAGYPNGLAGEQIPLPARIVSIVDVYDALSVKRVYKSAIEHARCVDIIQREAGKQFDPDLVEVFLTLEKQFQEISCRFAEPEADSPTSRREMAGRQPDDEIGDVQPINRQSVVGNSPHIEEMTGAST